MKRSILIYLLTATSLGALAQGNFSPYSQFGLGDIEDGYYNRTTGMGNTGIAYRSNRFLINNNPASFSALSNQYFTMETSLRGSYISYAGTPVNVAGTESADITFRRLAMGIKLSKNWGSSIGLVPFSTENYEFNVPQYLQGSASEVFNNYYQGHGSVNKVYWANSYEFFHHLSLGIETGYIFGQMNQKNIVQSSAGASQVSTTNDINLQNLYVTYGLQLYGNLGKHWKYGLGGTFSNKTQLLASYNQLVNAADSSVLQNAQVKEKYIDLPTSFGAGFSLTKDDKFTWVGDYRYQNWNGVQSNEYQGTAYSIASSERGSLGFEISKKKPIYNARVEMSYFQAGVYYSNSYLQINGQQIKDYGVTMGIGANSLKTPLAYAIIFQYGIKGTTKNDLIRENYANVTFLINYGAIWYTKGKKFE